jgi:DNA-binding NarL/FixJ family response regulator
VVDAVLAHRPDVVLADCGMPERDGVEVIEELRRRSILTPVVIVSARDDLACLRPALDAGASGYVLRHHASAELHGAIRAALAGTTFIVPALAPRLYRAKGASSETTALEGLDAGQREILAQLPRGSTAKEDGTAREISPRTVEFHKCKLMERLGVKTSAEPLRTALRLGFSA